MNILYHPFRSKSNKYIELSQNAICSSGNRVMQISLKLLCSRGKSDKADVAIFNWAESMYCDSHFGSWKHIIRTILLIIYLKAQGIKIVHTFHNRRPHHLNSRFKKVSLLFTKWLYHNADRIIILAQDSKQYLNLYLSKKEIEEKSFYIPHPNYVGAYPSEISREREPDGTFHILFIGSISRYKNIELILRAASYFTEKKIVFHLYGKCKNESYYREITDEKLLLKNIDFHFGFVDDTEITSIIGQSDILLLPYDISSSMNSGTVILAFSNKRTVICPEISTIKEFDGKDIFCYTYQSMEEHLERLVKSIENAYEEWKNDYLKFVQHGERLYQQVSRENSLEIIAEKYRELFEELSKKR